MHRLLRALGHAPAKTRQARGRWAEQLALEHLQAQGLKILERNYRCSGGEIDLILRDGGTLVFAEVRYRARTDYGSAAESVDRRKQERILHCAQHYLQRRHPGCEAPCRFDVVLVQGNPRRPGIEWIPDAFQA